MSTDSKQTCPPEEPLTFRYKTQVPIPHQPRLNVRDRDKILKAAGEKWGHSQGTPDTAEFRKQRGGGQSAGEGGLESWLSGLEHRLLVQRS